MGALTLPDGTRLELFGSGGAESVAAELSKDAQQPVRVMAHVPLSQGLREAGDAGTPIVLSNPSDAAAQALTALATQIATNGPSRVGKSLL
jgi:ATP-binding protein involved in chromosome partitioning